MLMKRLAKVFPAPWPAIWVSIMLLNILLGFFIPSSQVLTFIRLSGIFLCLVYTRQIFKKDLLLQLALLVTFLADIILAVNNVADIGIICFLIAQIIHATRLNGKQLQTPIIIFSILAFVLILANAFLQIMPSIYIICTFYVTALVANLIISWRWRVAEPANLRATFAVFGFLLFLCCDICTGISYLALNAAFPAFFYAPANFFAWFFYYPSQILVSNSSKCAKIT